MINSGDLPQPGHDCAMCPRLAGFRATNRASFPDFFNAPVPSFGPFPARLLVVGLAPGLRGANRTGRPFTGDYAGDLLYETLLAHGFARGRYDAAPDDGLKLVDCRVTNAVRCVPPENKPNGHEARTCRTFLAAELVKNGSLNVVLALGRVAHDNVISALGLRRSDHPFGHGARHRISPAGTVLFDSFHCSRYNTNTGRLTRDMFRAVFAEIRTHLDTTAR